MVLPLACIMLLPHVINDPDAKKVSSSPLVLCFVFFLSKSAGNSQNIAQILKSAKQTLLSLIDFTMETFHQFFCI